MSNHVSVLSVSIEPSAPHERRLLLAGFMVAAAALVLAVYLTVVTFRGGDVAGCGPGSGCDAVMASAWSRWLGVPVGALAVAAYTMIVAALGVCIVAGGTARRLAWNILLASVTAVAAAGMWFMYVMSMRLGDVCVYCTATHISGFLTTGIVWTAWVRARRHECTVAPTTTGAAFSVVIGFVAAALLVGGQVLRPTARYQVHQLSQAAGVRGHMDHHDDDAGGTGIGQYTAEAGTEQAVSYDTGSGIDRIITPTGTTVRLAVADLPVLGDRNAKHMVIFMKDYMCPQCQNMHRLLTQVLDRYKGQLAVVVVPFPLNSKCNSWLKGREIPERYVRSCEMARLALAVHRADADGFPRWDAWVGAFGGTAPLADALSHAVETVGRDALNQALSDPWINEQIERNVELYASLPANVKTIPVLLLQNHYITGTPERPEALYEIIASKLGIQPTDHLKSLLTPNQAQ